MDLKQLEYFVHVAEFGSFTRASAFLRVAQPALSRQIRSLEVELRQTLFERNGRGVTLTEAGKRLLAHGRGILQQVDRARQDMEDQRGAGSGHLSVGMPLDLMVVERDALRPSHLARIGQDDSYYQAVSSSWGEALKTAFHSLPDYSFYREED